MDRNTLIALVLVGLVLLLWPVYMKRVAGVQPEVQEQTASAPVETMEPGADRAVSPEPEKQPIIPISTMSALPAAAVDADTLIIENEFYRARFSTLGGGSIVSWKLKKHFKAGIGDKKAAAKNEAAWVELIPDSALGNLAVLTPSFYRAGTNASEMNFTVMRDSEWEMGNSGSSRLRFVKEMPNGARIEKVYTTRPKSYYMDMSVNVSIPDPVDWSSGYTVQWKSGLNSTEADIGDEIRYYMAYALQGDELLKTKDKPTGLRQGQTEWMAIRNKYFMMALISESGMRAAELEGIDKTVTANGKSAKWKTFSTTMISRPFERKDRTDQYRLYVGPIDYRRLKSGEAGLEKVMSFGWTIIKPFSIAFMYTLEFLSNLIGNFGWAIIVFSILIKAALYPLTRKSYESMRAMQDLQPKITALKEKYKKDAQKLNQETMKLYKENGVNPMGGCLPMLLQMPVLFALFNLFRTTIMLRQADFLLISDLSAPDAMIPIAGGINLLPVLMGITMMIQQRLSTQSNPQQKSMALIMPVFLTFIFYKLSAALNLYYFMFNSLTIAQELLVKRRKKPM